MISVKVVEEDSWMGKTRLYQLRETDFVLRDTYCFYILSTVHGRLLLPATHHDRVMRYAVGPFETADDITTAAQ